MASCPIKTASTTVQLVQVDLLFDSFGTDWTDLREGAIAAEQAGFDAVWLNDHLSGSVHGASHVLECWTTLTALSAVAPRLAVGSLVLNVANRDPGLVALMAATLQQVSGGRLLLGIGAGGGLGTPYAAEQEALGRHVGTDRERRRAVEEAVATIRTVWQGTVRGVPGFLRPDPAPPILVAGFGPKMAELAGRVGDGMCTPVGPRFEQLVEISREARARAGREAGDFLVIGTGQPSARAIDLLTHVGANRFVAFAGSPHAEAVRKARRALDELGVQ